MTRDTLDMFEARDRGRFGDNEAASTPEKGSASSDLLDIDVALHRGSPKAILVSIDGDESRAEWIPRSQIALKQTHNKIVGTEPNGQARQFNIATVTIPRWLATKAGLV